MSAAWHVRLSRVFCEYIVLLLLPFTPIPTPHSGFPCQNFHRLCFCPVPISTLLSFGPRVDGADILKIITHYHRRFPHLKRPHACVSLPYIRGCIYFRFLHKAPCCIPCVPVCAGQCGPWICTVFLVCPAHDIMQDRGGSLFYQGNKMPILKGIIFAAHVQSSSASRTSCIAVNTFRTENGACFRNVWIGGDCPGWLRGDHCCWWGKQHEHGHLLLLFSRLFT